MSIPFLDQFCTYACASIKAELGQHEVRWLLRPAGHIAMLARRRNSIIVSRVRLIAGLFALLTPLWVAVDVTAFPPEIWHGLVGARLAATGGFAAILIFTRQTDDPVHGRWALAFLLAVPTVFFIFSYSHMGQFHLEGVQAAFKAGYGLLPFVMVAGLSIFPLTLAESLLLAAPMLLAQLVAGSVHWPPADWPVTVGTFWLLILISAVSALAGLSQLAFMIVLVRDTIRDKMTGCFSRTSGEELLELQFIMANRVKVPMVVAFIDVDHFKQINDTFGHDAGDHALADAAARVRNELRSGDILIRWGGDEFLLVMPNVNAQQACIALERVRRQGIGLRPDGQLVTASIGVAERIADAPTDWKRLIEIADERMYLAKQAGRNRVVGCDGQATSL